jgi:hypothetical protein
MFCLLCIGKLIHSDSICHLHKFYYQYHCIDLLIIGILHFVIRQSAKWSICTFNNMLGYSLHTLAQIYIYFHWKRATGGEGKLKSSTECSASDRAFTLPLHVFSGRERRGLDWLGGNELQVCYLYMFWECAQTSLVLYTDHEEKV